VETTQGDACQTLRVGSTDNNGLSCYHLNEKFSTDVLGANICSNGFALLIPTFIGITRVVYAVLLLLPGGPVDVLLGREHDAEVAQRLRAEWRLDQHILVQYATWLWHIVQGDWGRSTVSGRLSPWR
jgi:ABC-type microcin C transport system permease subunit YejB